MNKYLDYEGTIGSPLILGDIGVNEAFTAYLR